MQRISVLDGLRGIAVLMVIVFHYFSLTATAAFCDINLYVFKLTKFLSSGVDLFFVLSGFLLGGILINNINSKNYFKTFYIRRFCRILPLYFLLIIICVVLVYVFPVFNFFEGEIPFVSYLTFTQNFFMGKIGFMGSDVLAITWSLAVEEQFYLFLPLIIFVTRSKNLHGVVFFFVLCSILFRTLFPGINGVWNLAFILHRMDSLFIGVSTFMIYSEYLKRRNDVFYNKSLNVILILIIAVLLVGILLYFANIVSLSNIKFTWIAFFYASIILFVLINKDKKIINIIDNKLLGFIGKISFGIYIYHQLIIHIIFQFMRNTKPVLNNYNDLILILTAFLFTVLISFISYTFFERKIINIGLKYKY